MAVRAGLVVLGVCLSLAGAGVARAETLYGTYFGGNGNDSVNDMAMDSHGRLVVVGHSDSQDWPGFANSPWPRATCEWYCTDAFVARLSADGRQVEWFLWLSGKDVDKATDVAVGPDGTVWVLGETHSSDFRTLNAHLAYPRSFDTFVGRIDASGEPTMVTRLGGDSNDRAGDVAIAPDGDAVVVGETLDNFPTTPGAYTEQPPSQSGSGFAARYAADGSGIEAATYIGRTGGGWDWATDLAIDPVSGAIVVGGNWIWETYPTTDAGAVPFAGYNDAWVAAFTPDLSKRLWAIARGTTDQDEVLEVAISPARHVSFLVGHVDDDWPTTEGAWDRGGWEDPFNAVESLDLADGRRGWATLLAASGQSGVETLTPHDDNRLLVAGLSFGTRFSPSDPACRPCPLVGYVARLAADGSNLEALGIIGEAEPLAVRPLAGGTVWVAGRVFRELTTTADALDGTYGGGDCEGYSCDDGFVSRIRLGPYPPPPPNPPPPPAADANQPDPAAVPSPATPRSTRAPRRIEARFVRRRLAGRVTSRDRACTRRVRVLVERRLKGRWVPRRRVRTTRAGRFTVTRPPRGRLRVRVPATMRCGPASRLVRRSGTP